MHNSVDVINKTNPKKKKEPKTYVSYAESLDEGNNNEIKKEQKKKIEKNAFDIRVCFVLIQIWW